MAEYSVPYGKSSLQFLLPDSLRVDVIAPYATKAAADPLRAVEAALETPLGGISFADFSAAETVAIAINDKTRPVPHKHLLPPLLNRFEALGIPREAITLIIATGTHPPMQPDEYSKILPPEILAGYRVICHDCDDAASLEYLGATEAGTPVWMNREYMAAALRVVVGNIEPHQFQGFSGGVKSAAIGLAGRETINVNHALMMDPHSQLGAYTSNPARQDVEAIGALIGVHFALNAILNDEKQIVHAIAGDPRAVMEVGIPLSQQVCQVPVTAPYDLLIVSPGGMPKDINLYQAQKGLAHASIAIRAGGTIILAAACPEGTGSRRYEEWVLKTNSLEEVFSRFKDEGFQIGPHKAYQLARDVARVNFRLISEFHPEMVSRLHLNPALDLQTAIDEALAQLSEDARIGIMPWANATIPVMNA